jgi:hypothetical protein
VLPGTIPDTLKRAEPVSLSTRSTVPVDTEFPVLSVTSVKAARDVVMTR